MITRVVVSKRAEAGFRRRALAALPNEYIEVLVGFVHKHTAYVCAFMPIKHKATPDLVDYDDEDWEEMPDLMKDPEFKLRAIGSIHTHPDRDMTLFSEFDLECLQKTPEEVMAICAIEFPSDNNKLKRNRCRIAYWPGVTPLHLHYK